MMGGVLPKTCWASYKYGIIKFWYNVASCWVFLYEWNWLSNLGTAALTIIDLIADWDHPATSQLYSLFEKIPTQDFKRQVTLRYHSRTRSWYMVYWKTQPWLSVWSGEFGGLLQWSVEVTYTSPIIHLQCLQDVVTHTVQTAVACLLDILRSCLDFASIWTCHQESVTMCLFVVFLWPKNVFYLFTDIHWRW
jgi:hypothetical protein